MANPRKFSEKIALHNQKQAEGTAQFEQIMREVSDATNKVNPLPKQHLRINQTLGSYRGGSLPNVNHVISSTVENKNDLPNNTLSNSEELNSGGRADAPVVYRERGRSVGVGPMRSRPIEKRIDTSPYGGAYLSPPPDTSWRRTISDSALHHSAMAAAASQDGLHSPGSQRRANHDSQMFSLSLGDKCVDSRPRSCYDVPRVPGIHIYPSQHEPGTIQIPIGNNTGSLPDLTSFHFPPPLQVPLDQEEHSSSPYSTSPQGTSPATLSPTSLTSQARPQGRFPFGGNSPQESRVPSPHPQVDVQEQQNRRHYSQQQQQQQHNLHSLVLGQQQHSPGGPHSPTPQNHLSVPALVNSSYLHQAKGVTQDHSGTDSFSQNVFVYQRAPVSPPLANCTPSLQATSMSTQQQQQHSTNSLNSYRSPQPNRPSPQSSPGLTVQYRSASPNDGHNSAPPSPSSPAGSPASGFSDTNYYFTQALQQHFEQFNMGDTPVSTTVNFITQNSTSNNQVLSPDDQIGQELVNDNGYYSTSPSQLQYNRTSGSTQQTTPQTPNTPSSIPDIILTDFSSGTADELNKHEFVKDLGSAMSGTFDLFPSDETLREGLDPIDFDGFQMLTDPDMNVIADPSTEDHFRMDRL